MWKKIGLVALLLVAAFLVVVVMQPDEFRVSRSAVIPAPAGRVFAQIDDFHAWDAWSPWAKLDPRAVNSFSGPRSGVGATFSWAGNAEVGEGSMKILESKPNELVKIKLTFVKPMPGDCDVEFALKPESAGTSVTWSMSGKNDFMGKLFGLIFNCEAMVGKYFEEGLDGIKKAATAPEATAAR